MVRFPTRALLARLPSRTLLVDCGFGLDFSEALAQEFKVEREPFLNSCLNKLGVDSEEVTEVVLTHSHFDHVLGATQNGTPTFPKARYHIQKLAWDDSSDENWKSELAGRVNLLDGDTDLFPGVRTFHTGGHSRGHQVVLVEGVLFPADICPSRLHLQPECVMDYDVDADRSRQAKEKLLDEGRKLGWALVFSHDPEQPYLWLSPNG